MTTMMTMTTMTTMTTTTRRISQPSFLHFLLRQNLVLNTLSNLAVEAVGQFHNQ